MTRILITGADSFVGNNFRKLSKYKDINEVSLLNIKLEEIEFERYDIVLHVAAIVHQSKKIPESEYFRVNCDLSLRVAERSRSAGIKQFIFLSTLKVYGKNNQSTQLRNEESECLPNDAYGKSKFAAEKGLQKMGGPDFIVSIVRTPVVYGEGVKANMISLMRLIDKFSVLPFAKIENKRNFTFTGNLTGFIDKIIEKKAPGVFIAMDENAISTTDLVRYISIHLEKKVFLFKMPRLCLRVGHLFIPEKLDRLYGTEEFDNKRTKEKLNYSPAFSTDQGIKAMVLFYERLKKL